MNIQGPQIAKSIFKKNKEWSFAILDIRTYNRAT